MLGWAGRVKLTDRFLPWRGSAPGFEAPPETIGYESLTVLDTERMRAAAVDLGKVRVGLAVADELGLMAHPRHYLDGRDPRRLLGELSRLAVAEGITVFVIGLPRQLNGKEGLPAQRARRFAESLKKRTQASVELIDEWLSTREAHARLREGGTTSREARERVDSAAAAVLLQSWLDAQRTLHGQSALDEEP